MGLTDFLISFSIIMMMLSFVSERASNFIKLYFQSKIIYIPFIYVNQNGNWKMFLSAKLEILAYSQPTQAAEKEREYRVMIINIIIGILIAAMTNANFFEIVKKISSNATNKDVVVVQGWLMSDIDFYKIAGLFYLAIFLWSLSLMLFNKLQENITCVNQFYVRSPFLLWIIITMFFLYLGKGNHDSNYIKIINHTIGYVFVGIFLSLGSKFWHDLLDILFQLKNAQQALSENKTYTVNDAADKVMARGETSQYTIAEKLFALYKNDIDKIQGVVSYGLNTIQDSRSKLFIKMIEVEFTTAAAQNELLELQNKGSIVEKFNTYHLKDYLKILYTAELTAITGIGASPVCYAYNANSPNSTGSFSVFEKKGEYFAESNLHVFADDNEFINFQSNQNYQINHRDVYFQIGSNSPKSGIIIDYKFGNYGIEGIDYCLCKIDKKIYDDYQNAINVNQLKSVTDYEMKMFGSVSKYVDFHTFKEGTMCEVGYSSFKKKLYLYKIGTSTPGINNIMQGDSGSLIYYRIKTTNNKSQIYYGILVAKSDSYAYMFFK